MSSLTELLMSRLSGGDVEQLSNRIGADRDATGKALSAVVPLLFSAMARNAGTEEGRQGLDRAVARDHDGSVLDQVSSLFSSGETADGNAILRHVLGDRRAQVEEGVSRASGLASNQARDLMAMVAPLVMGALGRARSEQGLDAGGLAGLLAGERTREAGALGGLAGLLDRDGDGSIADDVLGGLARGLKGRFFGS